MNREQFLSERKSSLGGSDIGAILGLSKFKSPVDVWLEKTGRKQSSDESTLPQRFGIFGESFVAQEYTRKTGLEVVRYNKKLVHNEYPFITGSIDRLVIPEGEKIAAHQGSIRTNRGMEAKCVSAYAGGEWGDDDSDDVPPYYLAQCAWYRMLTGCRYWDLAALIGNHRFEVYEFGTDKEIEDLCLAKAIEFWNGNVLADIPPPPMSEDDIAALYPKSQEGKKVGATDEILAAVEKLKKLNEQEKQLEKDLEAGKVFVKPYMQAAEALILTGIGDKPIATWKNNKSSKVTDFEAALTDLSVSIKNQFPQFEHHDSLLREIIIKHTKEKLGHRVFLLK